MGTTQFSQSRFSQFIRTILAMVIPVALLLTTASASSTKVLYAFAGGNDGEKSESSSHETHGARVSFRNIAK